MVADDEIDFAVDEVLTHHNGKRILFLFPSVAELKRCTTIVLNELLLRNIKPRPYYQDDFARIRVMGGRRMLDILCSATVVEDCHHTIRFSGGQGSDQPRIEAPRIDEATANERGEQLDDPDSAE